MNDEMPGAGWIVWIPVALIFSCVFAIIVAVVGAVWYFVNLHQPLGSDNGLDDWANFATFMGFVAQTLLGGATLAVAILISGVLCSAPSTRRG